MKGIHLFCSLLAFGFMTAPAFSASDCAAQARTELEKAYCQIEEAGQAAGLPSLREFRNNPPKTQRLLLRRPAERAGVQLPAEPVRQAAQLEPDSGGSSAEPASQLFCQLRDEQILCAKRRYRLIGNRSNSTLDPQALSAANRLQLPQFGGGDRQALLAYLDSSYQLYIEAMVSVGLAASTMSFTKFYHTYREVAESGGDFAGRMATMFEYLKKDKRALAVSAHPTNRRPTSIDQCRTLNDVTIVCDDVKHNWIYRSKP